jgi:hypothetical protein
MGGAVDHRRQDRGSRLCIGQGGSALIDLTTLDSLANVHVTTAWIDHCEVQITHQNGSTSDSHLVSDSISIEVDPEHNAVLITSSDDSVTSSNSQSCSSTTVALVVPELFSIHIAGRSVNSVTLTNKLMGNFTLETGGDPPQDQLINLREITLDKIKGEIVKVDALGGTINIKKSIEGSSVVLSGHQVNAKLIHGTRWFVMFSIHS